jgi:pyruvate-ferredoxin/flavodoxin oxidoreductase
MTIADFAATEARFGKQFKKAPPETWNDDMVPLAEFLQLSADEREGRFPYIWGVDAKNRLIRLLVAEEMVRSCEERRNFWRQLKDVANVGQAAESTDALTERVKAELMQKIAASLGVSSSDIAAPALAAASAPATTEANGYEPCWIESPECTACDECTNLAPKVFAYNDQKQAIVLNAKGSKYADIVKAAEKCTAGCIHPGLPWNMAEPGVDKLIARAEKFN